MSVRTKMLFAAALLAGFITACNAENPPSNGATMKLHLTTTAFAEGQPIPRRHAFDDQDLSPALQWSGVPPAAKSLALICDDPDAPMGTWVHWVIYDLPPSHRRPFRRGAEIAGTGQWRQARDERLQAHRLRRALSAARQSRTATFSSSMRLTRSPISSPASRKRICSRRWTAMSLPKDN